VPIEPWWEPNPATTPRQELGMVSPELPRAASKDRWLEPEWEDALTRRSVTRYRMLTTLYLFGALCENPGNRNRHWRVGWILLPSIRAFPSV
jgi:hypothetical protein